MSTYLPTYQPRHKTDTSSSSRGLTYLPTYLCLPTYLPTYLPRHKTDTSSSSSSRVIALFGEKETPATEEEEKADGVGGKVTAAEETAAVTAKMPPTASSSRPMSLSFKPNVWKALHLAGR